MRFTIRDVLWLTVVMAVLVSWWVRERQVANHEKAAKELEAQSVAELKLLNNMMLQLQEVDRQARQSGARTPATPDRP